MSEELYKSRVSTLCSLAIMMVEETTLTKDQVVLIFAQLGETGEIAWVEFEEILRRLETVDYVRKRQTNE